jgi:hypothetical protein
VVYSPAKGFNQCPQIQFNGSGDYCYYFLVIFKDAFHLGLISFSCFLEFQLLKYLSLQKKLAVSCLTDPGRVCGGGRKKNKNKNSELGTIRRI